MTTEKDYMNVESVFETIYNIYKEERDSYSNDEYFPFIEAEYDNETLEELAWTRALVLNDSMNKYLHQGDHRIEGNFNNIDYNYAKFVHGEFKYDNHLVCDLVKRLDDGLEDERTNADRDFLSGWLWETFGTFGIRYNFRTYLSEALNVAEEEKSMAM